MQTIKTNQNDEETRMLMQLLEEEANVDIAEEIKYPPVALSCGTYQDRNIDGTYTEYPIPLGTYGNFSFVQAPPKSMKSFFSSLLVSAYQQNGNKYTGKIKGHRQGKHIVHFDTEQGKFHCQKVFRRTMIMNDIKTDDKYHTYSLRSMGYKSRIDFIEYILKDKLQGKEIGLVVIDGAADLVSDVNNLEQCSEITQRLMSWTVDYNCHITTIIHSNFGSDKPTGHLGSFLEKKAETQIKLEKNHINKGWVSVECKRSRNRGFDTFSFEITDDGLPSFIDNSIDF